MAMAYRFKSNISPLQRVVTSNYLLSGKSPLKENHLSNLVYSNAERSIATSTPAKDSVKNMPQDDPGYVNDPRRSGGPTPNNVGRGNFSLVKPVFFPKKNLKRKIKRIELPSLYAEVSYRTMKAVIFYGPHKDHLPRDVRSGLKVISPASDWPDW